MSFRPILCWFATISSLVLAVAWVMTIWCTMRWTYTSGLWVEFKEGRITAGHARSDDEFNDFDILARSGPVVMRWGFDSSDRRTWAVPFWAPLLVCGTLALLSSRGGNAYSR